MKIIDNKLLDRLSAEACRSPRLRMNHNFHERLDDPVNRLLNALEPETYLPMHRHLDPAKDEAILVLRGRLASYIFNDAGQIVDCTVIDPTQGVYGIDIPAGTWHGLLVLEPGTVVYEVKAGPYTPIQPSNTAPWTPATNDTEGISRFLEQLRSELPGEYK